MSRSQVSPEVVHGLIRELNTVDPEVLLQEMGRQLRELFSPDLVLIFQWEPRQGNLVPSYSDGYERARIEGLAISGLGRFSDWLAKNRGCLDLSRQLGLLDQLHPAEREMLNRLQAEVCVPLISLKHLIGIVFLGSRDPAWRLGREDIQLLETLSTHAALALENTILYSRQTDRLAAIGQLAAGVAHEIRNPLSAISSTMQYILRDFKPDHPRRPLVEGVVSEVERIDRTIQQLLDLARRRDIQPREQNLLNILEQSLLLMEGQARQRQIEIVRDYRGDDFPILGDADSLKQVFLNLFLNALQAMETGGTLQVRIEPWEPSFALTGRWVQVSIEDTGPGILEEHREHLFELFFTTKPQGTGLGLAISQLIVERHRGEIQIQSTPGAGTTVFLRLPLAGSNGQDPDR